MEYTFEEMNLLKDWIRTAGDELTNNGYDINGLADDKIGILYLTYLKRIVTAQPREILKPEKFRLSNRTAARSYNVRGENS